MSSNLEDMSSTVTSWSTGLARTGGYYSDSDWYDCNISRRMPHVPVMIQELVHSLPPLGEAQVCDLLAGSGALTVEVKKSYPRCKMSVVEKCPYRIEQCKSKLKLVNNNFDLHSVFNTEIDRENIVIPGGPYDVIVATLALHTLAGHNKQEETVLREKYSKIFSAILEALKPGGTFIYGDHVGTWGLYKQVRLMEDLGFVETDIAWRQEAFFVAGGRRQTMEDKDKD